MLMARLVVGDAAERLGGGSRIKPGQLLGGRGAQAVVDAVVVGDGEEGFHRGLPVERGQLHRSAISRYISTQVL
jgi:hypothetical protein